MPLVVHQPTATHDWVIEDSQRALLEGNLAKAAMNQDNVNQEVFMKNCAALRTGKGGKPGFCAPVTVWVTGPTRLPILDQMQDVPF